MAANHENCILFYGGSNKDWVNKFTETASRVAQHRVLQQHPLNISVRVLAVRSDNKRVIRQGLPTTDANGRRVDAKDIFNRLINNQNGWVVLSKGNVMLLSYEGGKMLQVMENFDQQKRWMQNLRAQGFGGSFMNFYQSL